MKTAVIGAGPAGMTAAAYAAKGGEVLLLEKNQKIGKKLFITGKGRCNITNNCSKDVFISNVVTNPRFLYSALTAFSPQDTIALIESLGCPLKTERGGRVFPQSDKSSDILNAFNKLLNKSNVNIMYNTECVNITKNGIFEILTNKGIIKADKVIICTGGKSYPQTGSTGEMFDILTKLGHTITVLRPSLCNILVTEKYVRDLAGLTLKNVKVSAIGRKKIFEGSGELLFTHNGLSGPLGLSMSAYLNKFYINGIKIIIDLKPALNRSTLRARIDRDLSAAKNKHFKNCLDDLLPKSLIPIIIRLSAIPPDLQANSVNAQQRYILTDLLKNLTFTADSTDGFERAVVTSGGVNIKEINPATMESKLINGLYFGGEVIDTDALTGGFNIQIALSTGYAAGTAASNN